MFIKTARDRKTITIRIIPFVSKLAIIILPVFYFGIGRLNWVDSATTSDTVQVSTIVDATISLTSPSDLLLQDGAGNIIGTGDTDGDEYVTWNVVTNNSAGYIVTWQAIETGTNTAGSMESAANDTIGAYTPGVANTPEVWSVATTDSEWGAHLGVAAIECTPSGLTSNDWGIDDTTNARWLNVHHAAAQQVCSSSAESGSGGDNVPVYFRAEVGANKFQPTGTYTVDVTLTATTQ